MRFHKIAEFRKRRREEPGRDAIMKEDEGVVGWFTRLTGAIRRNRRTNLWRPEPDRAICDER